MKGSLQASLATFRAILGKDAHLFFPVKISYTLANTQASGPMSQFFPIRLKALSLYKITNSKLACALQSKYILMGQMLPQIVIRILQIRLQ